jgi:hypothetical protein
MLQFLFDIVVFIVIDVIVGSIKWIFRGTKRIIKKMKR